jgi:hypothetical protein
VKFLRQLAAVLLTVAVVVALGLAWEHSSEAHWIAAPQSPGQMVIRGQVNGAPHGAVILHGGPGGQVVYRSGGGAQFAPSNIRNLGRTGEIEAGVIAAVVVLDVVRRSRRRARRARRAS